MAYRNPAPTAPPSETNIKSIPLLPFMISSIYFSINPLLLPPLYLLLNPQDGIIEANVIEFKGEYIMKAYLKKYGPLYTIFLFLSICTYLTTLLFTNRGILVSTMGLFALLVVGTLPAIFVHILHCTDTGDLQKADMFPEEEIINHAIHTRYKSTEQEDILKLMISNMKELKGFYIISRRQAKNAFFLAATMCIIGAIILLLSICALLFLDNYSETLTLSAIGGVIVEFIAGTTFFVYKKTLNQLNHYYRSLHENERFLSILHLTSLLSAEKRDDVYIKIIDSQLAYINQENWMDVFKEENKK